MLWPAESAVAVVYTGDEKNQQIILEGESDARVTETLHCCARTTVAGPCLSHGGVSCTGSTQRQRSKSGARVLWASLAENIQTKHPLSLCPASCEALGGLRLRPTHHLLGSLQQGGV